MNDTKDFIKTYWDTLYDGTGKRPKNIMIIDATEKDEKLLQAIIVTPWGWNCSFQRIAQSTYWIKTHANVEPLRQVISRHLGHPDFVIAQINC